MIDIFRSYYKNNTWAGRQSRSGNGSDAEETISIRRDLPFLFTQLGIKSILDIPCGDFNWWAKMPMPTQDEITYIGADLVPEIIEDNKQKYPLKDFRVLDITKDELPQVDLIFTRDCLGHLSHENVDKAVANIKKSKPKYFVATHWPKALYRDMYDGGWRPINMEHYLDEDFKLVEKIKEDYKDKYLGVWTYEPRG